MTSPPRKRGKPLLRMMLLWLLDYKQKKTSFHERPAELVRDELPRSRRRKPRRKRAQLESRTTQTTMMTILMAALENQPGIPGFTSLLFYRQRSPSCLVN